jgi:hypothetical protein
MPFETAVAQAQPAGYETPLLAIALARGPLPPSLTGPDKQTGSFEVDCKAGARSVKGKVTFKSCV